MGNNTRRNRLPVHVCMSCLLFSVVSNLVLSHSERVSLCLGYFTFCFLLLSHSALCSVIGSIPGRELILNFKNESFCARSAVLFSIFVQNKNLFFLKTAGFNPGHARIVKQGPI